MASLLPHKGINAVRRRFAILEVSRCPRLPLMAPPRRHIQPAGPFVLYDRVEKASARRRAPCSASDGVVTTVSAACTAVSAVVSSDRRFMALRAARHRQHRGRPSAAAGVPGLRGAAADPDGVPHCPVNLERRHASTPAHNHLPSQQLLMRCAGHWHLTARHPEFGLQVTHLLYRL